MKNTSNPNDALGHPPKGNDLGAPGVTQAGDMRGYSMSDVEALGHLPKPETVRNAYDHVYLQRKALMMWKKDSGDTK